MSNRININTENIRDLFTQAKQLTNNGQSLGSEGIVKLVKTAEKDGISNDEKLFLSLLVDGHNELSLRLAGEAHSTIDLELDETTITQNKISIEELEHVLKEHPFDNDGKADLFTRKFTDLFKADNSLQNKFFHIYESSNPREKELLCSFLTTNGITPYNENKGSMDPTILTKIVDILAGEKDIPLNDEKISSRKDLLFSSLSSDTVSELVKSVSGSSLTSDTEIFTNLIGEASVNYEKLNSVQKKQFIDLLNGSKLDEKVSLLSSLATGNLTSNLSGGKSILDIINSQSTDYAKAMTIYDKSLPTKELAKIGITQPQFGIYTKLPPVTQDKFVNLIKDVPFEQKSTLLLLLGNGTLLKMDGGRPPRTVLDNLTDILKRPCKEGVDKKKITCEVIDRLQDRKKVQQGTHGTCGAATVEFFLLKADPGEFTRIISNLVRNGGVYLKDRESFSVPKVSLTHHESNMNDTDIIFQSAIMEKTRLFGQSGHYDITKDDSSFSALMSGNSAMGMSGAAELLEKITGKKYDIQSSFFFDGNAYDKLKSAVTDQKKEAIVLVKWSDDINPLTSTGIYHYLTVNSIENDKVYVRNPWGNDETWPLDKFKDKLRVAIIEDN